MDIEGTMHISAKGNYGLRAVLDLALHYGQGVEQSADIAARQKVPESYLVQLLNQLRKAGLVRSVRGPKGGHALVKRPDDVTVGDVLAILEGPVDLLGDRENQKEDADKPDVFREVWEDVQSAIEGVLSSITFGDLCRRHQARHEHIVFRI
ncbi:MAG: Rrf2 family transcriptional regulator [bacterium]|nr:Rrf2 family transcriptional regulator [bacterium]